jgi:uncharacterized protein (UPF0147 family)
LKTDDEKINKAMEILQDTNLDKKIIENIKKQIQK